MLKNKKNAARSQAATQQAVVYARYSSQAQKDESIEQQLQVCQRYAQSYGLQIVHVYADRAISGKSDRRPQFLQMVEDAKTADWSYVIVYALDRFSRSRYDSVVYKHALKDCGVKVLSATEHIGDDPFSGIYEALIEAIAEGYSLELGMKVLRGMEDNATKGLVNGIVCYGYRKGADGRYVVDEAQAAVVLETFQRVRRGETLKAIYEDFNARGIRAKKGKPWNKASFGRMLSNERYKGIYIWGEHRIPGGIPQIVPEDLFDEVQEVLGNKRNPRAAQAPQRRRRESGVYLLTGKAFCGHCKSPLLGVSGTSKSGALYHYYTCKRRRESHDCHKKAVARDALETAVARTLQAVFFTDESIEALADMVLAHQKQSCINYELQSLQAQKAEIEKGLKNLLAAVEAGVVSSTLQERIRELEEEKQTVAAKLLAAEKSANRMLTREQIVAVLHLFQSGDIDDPAYRERLIDTFVVAVYVYDDEIKIVFRLGENTLDKTVPFDIDSVETDTQSPCSYSGTGSSPNKNDSLLGCLFYLVGAGDSKI